MGRNGRETAVAEWRWAQDGVTNWTRGEMIYDSSGKMDGSDRRGAIWAPMPVYDEDSERWNLFCEPPPNPSPTPQRH